MSIKRVKLNYQPVAERTSNEIAFVVSKEHLNAVNNSIRNKLERNKEERIQSSKSAKDYHISSHCSDVSSPKTLVKIKNKNINL